MSSITIPLDDAEAWQDEAVEVMRAKTLAECEAIADREAKAADIDGEIYIAAKIRDAIAALKSK